MTINYQDKKFINYPKKYFNIDSVYGSIRCRECNWSPSYAHSHIQNIHVNKTCRYIKSTYNMKFNMKIGATVGSIKPEKLNLTCPICLDKKYCIEGYFDCEHHVCKYCYSLIKPSKRLINDDDDCQVIPPIKNVMILCCPLCRSE